MSFHLELPLQPRLDARERPAGAPVMYQRWSELLFLHWSVPAELVQAGLPPGLRVDTYEGRAWVGVVPFLMGGVRPRGLPAVPGLSYFPELNLRTYVYDASGRQGVWFYSLDTPNRMANWIARTFFYLNYRTARMQVQCVGDRVDYRSSLKCSGVWDEPQAYSWLRQGLVDEAKPGSLEFFLVERYRLFAFDWKRGRLFTGQVHHLPYPIQSATLVNYTKRLFSLSKFDEPEGAPESVLCSPGVEVTVYALERV